MEDEMKSLYDNSTFEVVQLPYGKNFEIVGFIGWSNKQAPHV